MNQWIFIGKICAVLGCGLIAGVFFAFSTFVMGALARIQPAQGISAMQSINIVVINPLFMGVFMGTAGLCLLLAISALTKWNQTGTFYLFVGCLLYLIGTFLVTIAFNVPLNDALAKINPVQPESVGVWTDYVSRWTFWNHVRTLAALAATFAFLLALCQRPTQ